MPGPDLQTTFDELRAILKPYEDSLVVVHDEPQHYYLDTRHMMPNGKPQFFGAVRVGKRYVSYHLMPVYMWPDLLEPVTPALRSAMQGKSCFNFRTCDPVLRTELADLTRRSFDRCREEGIVV